MVLLLKNMNQILGACIIVVILQAILIVSQTKKSNFYVNLNLKPLSTKHIK